MKIDFWYGDTLEAIECIDYTFYPNDGEYRGNLYKGGRAVGDYVTKNSSELEKIAPGIFGD